MYTTRSLYRRANFDVNQTIFFEMLSADQCEEILMTAFEALERTGARVDSKKARAAFEKAGCWVDGDRVRIPSAKAEWALRAAPSRLTLCGSDKKRAVLLETANSHFGPGFCCGAVLDAKDGKVRAATEQDAVDIARMCNAMDNLSFAAPLACPGGEKGALSAYKALATYCVKPVVQPVGSVGEADAVLAMAASVAGGEAQLRQSPCVALLTGTHQSMAHEAAALDIVMLAAEKGVPVIYNSKLAAGQTAPVAIAGMLVVAVANTLLALTLSQIVQEGAPFIAGGEFSAYDDAVKGGPKGAPESCLAGAGFANVLRRMHLPGFNVEGISDAKVSDTQSAAEGTLGILLGSLAGNNMICGGGVLESGKLASTTALAVGDEAAGIIRRIMRSVEIDEDRIGRGVIDEVGPGGNYLGTDHTNVFFKSEQYWPHLQSRKRIDDWEDAGAKSMGARGDDWVREILAGEAKPVIGDKVAKALDEILAGANVSGGA